MKQPFLNQQRERWNSLIAKGKSAGLRKDLRSASEYFEAAYKTSRNFPKIDGIRQQSAFFLGYAKFQMNDKTGAISYFAEFLDHPESAQGSEKEVADVHSLLGACFYASDNEKATEHFEKALVLKNKLGLPTLEVDTILGAIKMLKEDYTGAIPLYESAYKVQKYEDKDSAQKLALQLAYAHRELGDTSGETKWQKENLRYRNPKTSYMSEEGKLQIRSDVPQGWGNDTLSHFLETSQQNELSTFVKLNIKYKTLQRINDRFLENRQNLVLAITPKIIERYDELDFEQLNLEPKDWLEIYFYLRTQGAFAGASKLALSAQIPEMYMLLRGVIENAMYGFYVWKKPDKKDVWLARDDSPEAKSAAKSEFKVSNMYLAIASVDSTLKDDVYKLYNDTIDMGAHPNVKTFVDHSVQKIEDGALSLAVTTLNPSQLDKAMDDVAATGNLVFRLFKAMYPDLID